MKNYNLRMMKRPKQKWIADMKKMSLNVINGAVLLKDMLVGALQYFQKHNKILYDLNIVKL